jgi:TRAP-type C4-dicarboxylate transport system permease large subunit
VTAAIRDTADRVPEWYGVFMAVILEAGFITPPVGLNVFVIKGVSGGQVEHYFRCIFPLWQNALLCSFC